MRKYVKQVFRLIKARQFINWIFTLNTVFYLLFLKLDLYKKKRLFYKNIKSEKLKSKLISRVDIIKKINSKKKIKKSRVCHIIGSGWSLNNSLDAITGNDFVIGFNYAALADIKFDVYFFEFGSDSMETTSENHLSLARKKISKETELIFFKNIWDPKNEEGYIVENWLDLSTPIKDINYLIKNKKFIDLVVDKAFNDTSDFAPQFCSTVIISLILAYQAKFDEIVIHGLDFGGEYFYQKNKKIETMEGDDIYGHKEKGSIHATAIGIDGVGMKEIIPSVYRFFKNNNVKLYCATEASPSSQFIPVYKGSN